MAVDESLRQQVDVREEQWLPLTRHRRQLPRWRRAVAFPWHAARNINVVALSLTVELIVPTVIDRMPHAICKEA